MIILLPEKIFLIEKNLPAGKEQQKNSNGPRTHNHLVHKQTLNHLAKLANMQTESRWSHLNFRYHAYFEQEVDIQATIECGFILKRVRDMMRTYKHKTLLRTSLC